jgi:hypothetical protein
MVFGKGICQVSMNLGGDGRVEGVGFEGVGLEEGLGINTEDTESTESEADGAACLVASMIVFVEFIRIPFVLAEAEGRNAVRSRQRGGSEVR